MPVHVPDCTTRLLTDRAREVMAVHRLSASDYGHVYVYVQGHGHVYGSAEVAISAEAS